MSPLAIYILLHLLGGAIYLADIFIAAVANNDQKILNLRSALALRQFNPKNISAVIGTTLFVAVWPGVFIFARLRR